MALSAFSAANEGAVGRMAGSALIVLHLIELLPGLGTSERLFVSVFYRKAQTKGQRLQDLTRVYWARP